MPDTLLEIALNASINAGKAILKVYSNENIESELKQDRSPLTLADKNAHDEICKILKTTNIPVLSEEGLNISYAERKNWELLWIVDPLDGTKEFINRNGDFTVNIALVQNGFPVLGVVYIPVQGIFYYGTKGKGAFRSEVSDVRCLEDIFSNSVRIPFSGTERPFTIVASRSHMNDETALYIKNMETEKGTVHCISRGSALKICMVAEGSADVYPRFGPTMEWDTAAGHAVAVEAGCRFSQVDGITPVTYNKENLLNPYFIVKMH
jgi:3'(2'), 5'-bisphosphate nucleotidase